MVPDKEMGLAVLADIINEPQFSQGRIEQHKWVFTWYSKADPFSCINDFDVLPLRDQKSAKQRK